MLRDGGNADEENQDTDDVGLEPQDRIGVHGKCSTDHRLSVGGSAPCVLCQSFIKIGAGVFFFGATVVGATSNGCFSDTRSAGATSAGGLFEATDVGDSSAGRGRGNGND
jgi:hypothetical protein